MWEETGVPGGNPRVRVGDHHTLSHTTTPDHEDRTRVAAVRSKCFNNYATRTYIGFCIYVHMSVADLEGTAPPLHPTPPPLW